MDSLPILSFDNDGDNEMVDRQVTDGLMTSHIVHLETQITQSLTEAAQEIEYVDCFDKEQRAEVHTILRAMLADTKVHRSLLDMLGCKLAKEEVADA